MLSGLFAVVALVTFLVVVAGSAACSAGLRRWQDLWAPVGAAAGLCTFALFQMADSSLPSLVGIMAGLFAGSGMAVTFGTVFLDRVRGEIPVLEFSAEDAEGLLDLQARIDTIRPGRRPWMITASLAAASTGLAILGTAEVFEVVPAVVGLLGLGGTGLAAVRLYREAVAAERMQELLTLDSGASAPHEAEETPRANPLNPETGGTTP